MALGLELWECGIDPMPPSYWDCSTNPFLVESGIGILGFLTLYPDQMLNVGIIEGLQ